MKTIPLTQSHLTLAHQIWRETLSPNDIVIDATCGNGHDTLFLASLAREVHSIDIQENALAAARKKLPPQHSVIFYHQCHSSLPALTPKLIVYNLGYLPGSDKSLTTLTETTLQSIQEAQKILVPGGTLSITCYPGHTEGAKEQNELLDYFNSHPWPTTHYQHPVKKQSPSLIITQKPL